MFIAALFDHSPKLKTTQMSFKWVDIIAVVHSQDGIPFKNKKEKKKEKKTKKKFFKKGKKIKRDELLYDTRNLNGH